MILFKRRHILRRFSKPTYIRGYAATPYDDRELQMDVQTTEDAVLTTEDGSKSVQRLKVFCDEEIMVERSADQKADWLWFQGRWFSCASSRLVENTPLRHWVATFVECADQEEPPEVEN